MENKLKINGNDGLKKWDEFISDLEFKSRSSTVRDIVDSEIRKSGFNCGSKLVYVDSSPYVSQLSYTGDTKKTIFLLNSISSLSCRINETSAITQKGTTILITSKERRISMSLILNIDNVFDTDNQGVFNSLCLQDSSNLNYGFIINKLFQELYSNHSDAFMEKSKTLISNTLSLEIERKAKNFVEMDKIGFTNDILCIIDENYRSIDFNLTILAKFAGVSEKTIQNKLYQYNLKFYSLLQSKRVQKLKMLLDCNPILNSEYLAIKSGFSSLVTANRQFLKEYQISISGYRKARSYRATA